MNPSPRTPANIIEIALMSAAFKPIRLSYCDYIAQRIVDALLIQDDEELLRNVGRIRWDLHPQHGYMLSTKKILDVTDRNGTKYRITVENVEEIPATNTDELVDGIAGDGGMS